MAFIPLNPRPDGRQPGNTQQFGGLMERDRTPVEARSGVISGRVLLVLVSSSVGAVVAVGLCWLLFFSH